MKHRLHVVSLPHTQTTKEFTCCAYTEKVRKFCRMMVDAGNEVFLYAGEQNEAPCTEHVSCIDEAARAKFCGDSHYVLNATFDATHPLWVQFNNRVIAEIASRLQRQDFICLIGGTAQAPIMRAFTENISLEFGVGYSGTVTHFRVYESYAWMHTCYGAANSRNPMNAQGVWYDEVIPGYLEREDFPAGNGSGDYGVFLGRKHKCKGVDIAADVCKRAGVKLFAVGPGDDVEGAINWPATGPLGRARLLGGARFLIAPTRYLEPFGNVSPEAQACGTPVICPDWGAFTETVVHGITGFRCRHLAEFVEAVAAVKGLDRSHIRERALTTYSLEAVGPQYQAYLDRLATLWGKGWYEGA